MQDKADLQIEEESGIVVVTFLAKSISDSESITLASKKIREFIEENSPKTILFDFGEVKFFSSQVLGLLLDTRARLRDTGGQVVIGGINPELYRVFKITNLDGVFKFFADKASAIESIDAG
ncbi:MAG: STAS domain-containing protein [Planctomycetota bacterium]|jgi:anti-sigma B factor antagonist